jgi:hypothetical protein
MLAITRTTTLFSDTKEVVHHSTDGVQSVTLLFQASKHPQELFFHVNRVQRVALVTLFTVLAAALDEKLAQWFHWVRILWAVGGCEFLCRKGGLHFLLVVINNMIIFMAPASNIYFNFFTS